MSSSSLQANIRYSEDGFSLANHNETFLSASDASVEQIPLKHDEMSLYDGHDHIGKL